MAWKNGKDPIHIKASRVGTFRAAASAAGRSVSEEAEHVLADPNASEHMREKAQFAENAEHWKH